MKSNNEFKETVIIADDDPDIREVIKALLEQEGYYTVTAENGDEAIKAAAENKNAGLMLLDIMMPGQNGIETCEKIRCFSKMPILFLTAKTAITDKKQAYDAGGDDFLAKPFSGRELILKVISIIRRYRSYGSEPERSPSEGTVCCEGISADTKKHRITINGEPADFTEKEYGILVLLISQRGKVFSPAMLYENVWEDKYLDSSQNTVMVHMLNLRRKLEAYGLKDVIRTVWGKGYTVD